METWGPETGSGPVRPEATKPAAPNFLQQQARFDALLERFNHERLAREDERHDSSTSEDESSKRLQWCLNNQWRPNFDPNGYERERENR